MTPRPVPLWWDDAGITPHPTRAALSGDATFDVVIVGAGYTGLWTAYYLAKSAPHLTIAVLEAAHVGHGASGRNGGWLAASVPAARDRLAARHGRGPVLNLVRALVDSVNEVLQVATREGIEMDAVHTGCIRVATTPAQARRLEDAVAMEQRWDADTHGWRLETVDQVATRVSVSNALIAAYTPHCARIQPAKLVSGLAAAVERLGVQIFEATKVVTLAPGRVSTPTNQVRARHVLRATEGYTGQLPGQARRWLPMNSSMIATEPLDVATWATIGWDNAEALSDFAHAYAYLQRTADGRIAIGGRGRPYAYAGRFDQTGATPRTTVDALTDVLQRLFPTLSGIEITHAWSGVLAVPRDWCAGVGYNPHDGTGWAGGYAGQGVTAANLAGRTLTDLVLQRQSPLTRLPWVDHHSRQWEPEPLRWLGVQTMYAAYRKADRTETSRSDHQSARIARIADLISGR